MDMLYQLLYSYPLLAVAHTLFMIGMAVDAYRRRAEPFWYWIILIIPILGAWVYFFAVVAPHLGSGNFPWFQRKVSLAELRHRVEQAPTLANNLALGQALIEKGAHAEALPLLETAHKVDSDLGSVLYALAQCHANLKNPGQAAAFLERIIQRDPRWSDYQAWHLLIEVNLDQGNTSAALEKARTLVQTAPTLRNKCVLAEILIDQGQGQEARPMLDRALADHGFTPAPLRKHNKVWAKRAGKLLKEIG